MDDKTTRKLNKCAAHVADLEASATVADLTDWLATAPSAWDADVVRAHAKRLEATGCHLRRLLADLEAQGVVTD
jgi:hypothetical protein